MSRVDLSTFLMIPRSQDDGESFAQARDAQQHLVLHAGQQLVGHPA